MGKNGYEKLSKEAAVACFKILFQHLLVKKREAANN
jgi:hypothetical protein